MQAAAALAPPAQVQPYTKTAGAPLVINGYQLRDALSLIAPQGTARQLATALCVQSGPARETAHGTELAGLFCWLHDFPDEGSVRLDEHPRHGQQSLSQHDQMIVAAYKLVDAARWVYRNAEARRQPDARALAKVVLRLMHPIISAHVDAGVREVPT